MGGPRRAVVLALAAMALVVGFGATPTVAAVGTTFGRPTATTLWGAGVTFEQPIVLATRPTRAEIVIESTADTGAFVSEVATPGPGPTTLSFTLDVGTTGFLPNTPFTARWRVTEPDGVVRTGPSVGVTYADTRFTWRTRAGPVVRVHWYAGDDLFGRRALKIGEDAIAKAASLLGVSEREPIDFFVYADESSFYDALGPGTRENVGGQANAEIRTLFALITPDEIDASWVGIVIPHELTHIVFDTAVKNPYHYPPRWLNEGLAVYLSQGYDSTDRAQVRRAAGDGELIPLDALTGEFPTTQDRFSLAYAESVAAVDFLVRTHGRDALVRLVRSYADGRTDDEAFEAALGGGASAFGAAWLADVGAATPELYGPQPAPAGPLPNGWTGPAPNGAPSSTSPGWSAPAASGGAAGPSTPSSPTAPGGADGDPAPVVLLVVALGLGIVGAGFYVARRRATSRPSASMPPSDLPPTGPPA